jgi:MOSC domain-containing protein YiiM
MAAARIVSVNTGPVADLVVTGRTTFGDGPGGRPHEISRSAIDKRTVSAAVRAGRLGLAGDEHGDTENHGGLDQAVYAYAREDLDWWTERVGRELRNGEFGENVTTSGLEVTGALIGEIWRMGEVVVQITSPRIPCETFKAWTGEDHWVRRFAAGGRPGAYLRVLTEGEIRAGDDIEVLSRPEQRVTVAESMLAYYGDAALMRTLLTVPGRGAKWEAIAARVLGRTPV